MPAIMLSLAENYQWGIGIISGVIIAIYITISIISMMKVRKRKGIISIACMIPIVNIFFLFNFNKSSKKNNYFRKDKLIEKEV